MALQLTRRRFTTDEYHQMAAAGILTEDDRVELIDGEIVEMAPIGGRHAACVDRLLRIFADALGHDVQIRVQNPIRLDDHTEPQPDIALLRARPDYYATGHPGPADILLLVEVADSSEASDRELKIPLYAHSNVPEVWLVDLNRDTITAYRNPGANGYGTLLEVRSGDHLAIAAMPDMQFEVADILGVT